MKGKATYKGYDLEYDLDEHDGQVTGVLRFLHPNPPLQQFFDTDSSPQADERRLPLEDGRTYLFRVRAIMTPATVIRAEHAFVDLQVEVYGRIE